MNYRKIILLFLTVVATVPAWAQDGASGTSNMDWAIQNIVLIMAAAAIFGVCVALYRSMKSIWTAQNIADLEAGGMGHAKAVRQANQKSFLGYIYRELAGGVPIEREADVMLNHDYDGIHELDNNLPPWWVGMFYVTIIFAVVYMGIYHFSDIGLSNIEAYDLENKEAELAIAAFNAEQAEKEAASITAETATILTEEARLAAGAETFKTYCAACHGMQGEGLENLGQNLTDEYWIHGGGMKNIFATITEGVPGKTMIAWKEALSPPEIQEVASYILTLEGTNPPNARPPEGDLWTGGKQ